MAKTISHTDPVSGATTTTTVDSKNVNVTQTPPTNFAQGNTSSSSTTTTSSSHDATTTVNGVLTHEEHNTTGPTIAGDAAQAADQQG